MNTINTDREFGQLFIKVFVSGSPMILRLLLSYLSTKEIMFVIQMVKTSKMKNPDKIKIVLNHIISSHPSSKTIKVSTLTKHSKATIISQVWKQHSNLCINCFIFPHYDWTYSSSVANQFPHLCSLCTGCARKHWDRLTSKEPIKIPFHDLLINNVHYKKPLTPEIICRHCLTSEIASWPPIWKSAFPPLNHYCFSCAYYLYPFHIVSTVDVKSDTLIPNRSQTFYSPALKKGQTKFRLIVPKVLVTDIPSSQSQAKLSNKRKRENSNDVGKVVANLGNIHSYRKTNYSSIESNFSDLRDTDSSRRSSRLGKRLVTESV